MDRPSTSALDKFKRRLVRDIARRLHQEKQEQSEIWPVLRKEYGCDCRLLWEHMKSLTLKKLRRLLAAEDRVDYITKIARMTSTDWLTFDLVLVHEKIDVIGEDLILSGKKEPAVLTFLVDLVVKHEVDSVSQELLGERWQRLTNEYNTNGRKCSPMLLQRRWYQLKKLTRSKFYDFWKSYRGNPRFYERAIERKPTELQVKIVEKFAHLITNPFPEWDVLVQTKMVILAEVFETKCFSEPSADNESDTDIIIIEPIMETIELAADSDSDEAIKDNEILDSSTTFPDEDRVTVQNEIVEDIEVIDVSEDPNTNRLDDKRNCEESDLMSKNILPKITSVTGNVVTSEINAEVNVVTDENIKVVMTQENTTIICDNEDSLEDNDIPISSDSNTNDREEADVIIVDVDSENVETANTVDNINKLSYNLEFVDDGIELVDEIEYQETIKDSTLESEKGKDFEDETAQSLESEDEFTIDPKLIMFPLTYTTKLDDMEIFKNRNYFTVKGKEILDQAVTESKPTFEIKNKNDQLAEETNCDESEMIPRLKYNSWRLQKPKSRSYNPIQLCKNPDFNTRLKRLTVGFFSSERNRLLFSACKPITIDLHKGFETKLVNNTIYLENNDCVGEKQAIEVKECNKNVSVIPSAIPIQSLLDNAKEKVQEILQQHADLPKELPLPNTSVTERSKVIKLLDIDQIRLNNQNLLVAEVSPTPIQNEFNENNTSVQMINTSSVIPPQSESEINCNAQDVPKVKRFITKKKFVVPKVRIVDTVPPWSYSITNDHPNDHLITQDTLTKMVCLIKGIQIEVRKPKRNNYRMKRRNKEVKHQTLPDIKKRTYKMFLRKERSIAWCSGYCCWAQHRLLRTPRDKKFRHLCSPPVCKCCCRELLLKEYMHGPYCLDQLTYFRKFVVDGRLTERKRVSGADLMSPGVFHEDDGNSEFETDVRGEKPIDNMIEQAFARLSPIPSPNITHDSIGILQEGELTNGAREETDTVKNSDPRPTLSSQEIMENSITVDESCHTNYHEVVENTSYLSHNTPNRAELIPILPDSVIDYNAINIESVTSLHASMNNQILPNGVKFILLPDNTLTMSIDPNAEIDQENLSSLPEILLAAQQQLAHQSNVIPGNNIAQPLNENFDQPTLGFQSGDFNIQSSLEKNNCKDNNLMVTSPPGVISAYNSPSIILKSVDQLEQNTHSGNTRNLIELDSKNNSTLEEGNSATINDITTLHSNKRKTILSDLMTISGISQEDFNPDTEESSPSPVVYTSHLPIPSTSNTVVDYNIAQMPFEYSLVEKTHPDAKSIKKTVIRMRKKNRSVLDKYSSVIDLTEDDPVITNKEKNIDHESGVSKKCVDTTDSTGRVQSPIKFYSTYGPVKINKELNTIGVCKLKIIHPEEDQNTDFVKTAAKLNSNKRVMNHKGQTKNEKCDESEADSSDDEPLAKKARRVRASSVESISGVGVPLEITNIVSIGR